MSTDDTTIDREVSAAELGQLEQERAERLDPANRPGNAEVDNTTREWDYEHEDFRDNIGDILRPSTRATGQARPATRRSGSASTRRRADSGSRSHHRGRPGTRAGTSRRYCAY
jgi:hypothetical protein